MNKLNLVTKAVSILEKHSPEILTVTAIGAVATYKAARKQQDKSLKETWTNYIPPVVSAGVAIGSVIALNFAHKKHYAALLATYTLTQADNERLKEKISSITIGKVDGKPICFI